MGDENETYPTWDLEMIDGRMRLHVLWCRAYAQNYNHGAPGHLDMLTIAKLADLLDMLQTKGTLTTPTEEEKA